MNEKLQYAEMLDIPVSTCNITYKPPKRRFRKKAKVNPEEVKSQLLEKVNSSAQEVENEVIPDAAIVQAEATQPIEDTSATEYEDEGASDYQSSVNIRRIEKPKKIKFGIVAVQFAIIGVLLATIFLTNALVPTSAINNIINGVFGQQTAVKEEDRRVYSEFSPVLPSDAENIVLEGGVMTLSKEDSVYAPCDGVVSSITAGEDGKFTIEITHSENFKSVFGGLDYAYCEAGDNVYSNIPVGYTFGEQATLCFMSGEGAVITDYSISENSVIWAV